METLSEVGAAHSAGRRINVCLVAPLPPPYGGISHWASLISSRAGRVPGIRLRVVNIAPRWREVHDTARWKRVAGGGVQLFGDLWRWLRCALGWRPQVMHLTTSGQFALVRDMVLIGAARLMRVPVVYHVRFGRLPAFAGTGGYEWRLFSLNSRMASHVIAIDKGTYEAMRSFLPAVKSSLIPNCYNPEQLPPADACGQPANEIVFIGWVIPAKGMEELIRAWCALDLSGWKLVVIGPGDAAYRNMLVEKYQPRDVEFVGECSHEQAMGRLAHAAIFTLPSYTEGFPNVVLEAMALGKPVVATPVGAIPEMLKGDCGRLVPVRDYQSLAAALRALVEDAGLRHSLSQRARDKAAATYSIDAVFAQYQALWGELARGGALS